MGKKKHHSRPHLDSRSVKADWLMLARESRMANITPWSIMLVITSYAMMMVDGWKQKRLSEMSNKVNEYDASWYDYKIEIEDMQKRLCEKAGWDMYDPGPYKESDIKSKKGTYKYVWDKYWIGPQNAMNQTATRYQVWFYNCLIDMGYGEKRLTKVAEYMDKMLDIYKKDKSVIKNWEDELMRAAGFVAEPPMDPKTGKHERTIML